MIQIRRVRAPEMRLCGQSTFITGQNNAQFAAFWQKSADNGLLARLNKIYRAQTRTVTHSRAIGVSRVEKDPQNRAFHFFIAAECEDPALAGGLTAFAIPACEWAVFRNQGALPLCLVESEIYAMGTWLPASGETHALLPELEVYPDEPCENGTVTEFWLPLKRL